MQLRAVNKDPQVTEVLFVIAFKRHTIFTVSVSPSCTAGTRIVGVPLCVSFATAGPPLPEMRNGVSRPSACREALKVLGVTDSTAWARHRLREAESISANIQGAEVLPAPCAPSP